MAPNTKLTELVKDAAREAGFDLAGIAPVSQFPELQYFREWIAEGRGGEMRYLEARQESGELTRTVLERVFPWARSVVVCAINYNADASGSNSSAPGPRPWLPESTPESVARVANEGTSSRKGWISRYARPVREYHDIVMQRLRCLEGRLRETVGTDLQTRCYVNTGPVVERVYARYAGIGWVGKNTCIINQRLGSWLFLGIILTSLEVWPGGDPGDRGSPVLGPASLISGLPAPDRCGTCTRCLDVCPTEAFLAPRHLDASRCISYLTIEKRGDIPVPLRAGVGQHVFGCDLCQDVCPWNRKAPVTTASDLQPRPELASLDLEWLATISPEDFQNAFRGSPIKRAKRSGLRRNAVVAMGNSGDRHFLSLLRQLANDADPVVASHAQWALEQLMGGFPASGRL